MRCALVKMKKGRRSILMKDDAYCNGRRSWLQENWPHKSLFSSQPVTTPQYFQIVFGDSKCRPNIEFRNVDVIILGEDHLDFDQSSNPTAFLTVVCFPCLFQLGGWSCNRPKCLLLRLSPQCAFPSGMETVKRKQGISSDTGKLI